MRCPEHGEPIVVERRFVWESTDGPMEHVKGKCAAGHPVCCSVEYVAEERT